MKTIKILFFVIFILLQSFTGKEQEMRKAQADFARNIYNHILPTYKRMLNDSLEQVLIRAKIIPNEYRNTEEFKKDSSNFKFIFIPHFYVNKNLLEENTIKPWFNLDCKTFDFKCIIFRRDSFFMKVSICHLLSGVDEYSQWIITDTMGSKKEKDNYFKVMKEIYLSDFDVVFYLNIFEKYIGFVQHDSVCLISYNDYKHPVDLKEYWLSKGLEKIKYIVKSNPCNEENLNLRKEKKKNKNKK